jgi:hypothetical protein
MNNYPTVISFYTDTWEYPTYARKLLANCNTLGLQSFISVVDDTGDWLANTRLKPKYILDTLKRLEGPVLWVDVDGSILKQPNILMGDISFDFAARKMHNTRQKEWHVGTLFFNYNERALAFLEKWNEQTIQDKWSDEYSLDVLWKSQGEEVINLKVLELPPEYFYMIRNNGEEPNWKTVVCHRASKGESKEEFMKSEKRKEFTARLKLQSDINIV